MTAIYPDLKGKKIFITGASSGIGKAQCLAFLDQGAIVFAVDKSKCNIKQNNFNFKLIDINDSNNIIDHLNTLNNIDIVCNTAGILDDFSPSLETSRYKWDKVINTNLTSMFTVTNVMVEKSISTKSPLVVVNMASIAGMIASGGGAAYTASKHAIVGYTKQLNFDYGKKGIRANCISPGAVKTYMTKEDFNNNAEVAKRVASETLIKRYADPSEVAELTLFLASDSSKYIYGANIPIDAGFILGKKI
ncbi:3-oxoacyl-ACP reductase [Companilactobacillus metriopterae]|uniref:3-oxoacyl-ACP reductase n=1 Tax=Companilactobacillus metriopterae TaxID=1909267 RepID=UPI00100AA2DA|nr:3-oxoacyl-ACP reductase [Companilactobacillus metriopterae]